MKKVLAVLLAILMVVSLSACGETVENNDNGIEEVSSENTSTNIDSSTQSEESKPTESSKPVESSKPSSNTATSSASKPVSSGKPSSSMATSSASKPTTSTHTHSYVKATCSAPAKCSCGAISGSALGHSYSKGVCSRCGAVDSNYVPKDIPVETILFDKISLSMLVGDTDILSVTVYPYNATNQILYWESSDPNVVSVDATGNLKAKSYGTATISAHSVNGVYAVDCQIFVKENTILTCTDFPLHLYSYDGKEYLGKLVTNKYDSDSIWNEYGKYGSKYQTNSIWNEYGKYGSKYQSTSAFNPYATQPPKIVTNSGKVLGYLTASEYKLNGYTIVQLERALKKVGQ